MTARWLMAWVALVQRRAWLVVIAAALLGAGFVYYTGGHLGINTSTDDMFSAQLPWRQKLDEMDRLFPAQTQTLAIVIDGDTPGTAAAAQAALTARLKSDPTLFPYVFALETEPFFRRNGLLYLDVKQLQALSDRLVQAQPFLGTLAQDPSLHGLFTLLGRAAGAAGSHGFDLTPALRQIARGVAAASEDKPFQLSWKNLMGGGDAGVDARRRFIQVKPNLDHSEVLPAAQVMRAVRHDIAALHLDASHGVRVRLTGSVALEYEELLSAASGAAIAFIVGLALVVLLLYLGLRSWRLVLAAAVTLVYGLLATTAFAAATVGSLNLISVAFGVLYIGLGIDYALYLCMQYRERLGGGSPHHYALRHAAGDVGGFMVVCALTTSIGFFAFTPTAFIGIAELGLISGVGMFISLIVSLTLLPALVTLLPPDPAQVRLRAPDKGLLGSLLALPYTHGRALWVATAVLGVGALFLIPHAHFDYDPLDLRDPHSESVSTYRDLLRDPNIPTLTMQTLVPDAAAAKAMSARLAKLPLVSRAMSIADFIPADQQRKLEIIQNLGFVLGPAITIGGGSTLVADDVRDIKALRTLQAKLAAAAGTGADVDAMHALAAQLQRFDNAWTGLDAAGRKAVLKRLRRDLLGSLPRHLADLRASLQAQPVTLADLPQKLVRRWVADDGRYRVSIWPKKILDNNPAMVGFVDQVHQAVPSATGDPVNYLESGRSVVHAFRHAFAYSVIAIALLLLLLLRDVVDTLFVLIPLALAGLFTVAEMVLGGVAFNFANVIALPLILGVGVDYGVYIVQSGRVAGPTNLLHTGTVRAVLFGALITVANFGNLALSHHPGTRSMGLLLTLGLGTTLICALVLLPSLLAWRYGGPSRRN